MIRKRQGPPLAIEFPFASPLLLFFFSQRASAQTASANEIPRHGGHGNLLSPFFQSNLGEGVVKQMAGGPPPYF